MDESSGETTWEVYARRLVQNQVLYRVKPGRALQNLGKDKLSLVRLRGLRRVLRVGKARAPVCRIGINGQKITNSA